MKTISDSIFYALSTFFASFIILNYFLDRPYSIILSACICLLALILAFYLVNKKNINLLNKSKNSKKINEILFRFCLLDNKDLLNYFSSALNNINVNNQINNKSIFIERNNSFILPIFSPDGLTKSNVCYAYNLLSNNQTITIYCYFASQAVVDFAKRFNKKITIVQGASVFELIKNADNLPLTSDEFIPEKPRINLNNLILKKRAKNYIVYGFAFYLLSFISPLKLYYIIVGSICFIFSAIVKLFGKAESPKNLY